MSHDRTRDLAAIHAAAKKAGVDDETRRAMIERISGGRTRSSADLGPDERSVLLNELGGRTRPARAGRGPQDRDLDRTALLRKIGAQLADARLPWGYAESILRRQRGLPDRSVACPVERATPTELRAVIAALWRRAKRAAAQTPETAP